MNKRIIIREVVHTFSLHNFEGSIVDVIGKLKEFQATYGKELEIVLDDRLNDLGELSSYDLILSRPESKKEETKRLNKECKEREAKKIQSMYKKTKEIKHMKRLMKKYKKELG